jgi:putative DNA primase/helicase
MTTQQDETAEKTVKKVGKKSALPSLSNIYKPLDRAGFPHQPDVPTHHLPCTVENLAHLLKGYGISVSNDVITKSTALTITGNVGSKDGLQGALIATVMSLATLNKMSNSMVPSYIGVLAKASETNCAKEWMESKPWDGVDRVEQLVETVKAAPSFPDVLRRALLKKWLLSVAAAATRPAFKSRGVLTYQGRQSIGKTTWFRSLVDKEGLRESIVKIDHFLDVHNKDSMLGALKHLIVELGELDSSFKRDFARMKGFLTSDQDKIRKPYDRMESEYDRRTVFCASVNEYNFLEDATGNSRFWTIPVESINAYHGIDMQQVFAQLLVMLNQGWIWWLNQEEEAMLEVENRKHRAVSVIRDLMSERIDVSRSDRSCGEWCTSSEVLSRLGILNPTNGQAKEGARTLREFFGPSKKIHDRERWQIVFRERSVLDDDVSDQEVAPDVRF